MASATYTSITTGTAYLSASVLGELFDTLDMLSLFSFSGGNFTPEPVAGHDVANVNPAVGFIRAAQDFFITHCTTFSDPTSADPDNTASLPDRMTVAEAFTAAGLGDGFRYATVYDPPGDDWAVTSGGMWADVGNGIGDTRSGQTYGRMIAGDIVGPWLIVDLQKALSALYVTWLSEGSRFPYWTGQDKETGAATWPVWDTAYTNAVADLSSFPATSFDVPSSICDGRYTGGDYHADLEAVESEMRYADSLLGYTRFIRYYAFTVVPPSDSETYDASGADVIEGKWSLYDSQTAGPGVSQKDSTTLGDSTAAPAKAAAPAAIDGSTSSRGFVVTGEAVRVELELPYVL